MATLLQIDLPFEGPFGEAMAEQLAGLAALIAEEPGLIWKIWTPPPSGKLSPVLLSTRGLEEMSNASLQRGCQS